MKQINKNRVLTNTPTRRRIPRCRVETLIFFLLCLSLIYLQLQTNLSWGQQQGSSTTVNQTHLILPFKGFWRVSQGNNGSFSHHTKKSKYAWDFVRVDVEGNSTRDKIISLEDYYTYNEPLYAPAAGRISSVVRNSPDGTPGELVYDHPANQVTIEHGNGEYSRLYHLKRDGIEVEVGDYVSQGQLLGYAGNSGPSTAPHVDYRLMKYENGELVSIPCSFSNLIQFKDQKFIRHATNIPLRGEIVGNAVRFGNENRHTASAALRTKIAYAELFHRLFFVNIDPYTFYLPTYEYRLQQAANRGYLDARAYLEGSLVFFATNKMEESRRFLYMLSQQLYSDSALAPYSTPTRISMPFPENLQYRIIQRNTPPYLEGCYRYVKDIVLRSDDPWVYVYAPVSGVVRKVHNERLPLNFLTNYNQPVYLLIQMANGEYIYLGHLNPNYLPIREGQHVSQGDIIAKTDTHPITGYPHLAVGRLIKRGDVYVSMPFTVNSE